MHYETIRIGRDERAERVSNYAADSSYWPRKTRFEQERTYRCTEGNMTRFDVQTRRSGYSCVKEPATMRATTVATTEHRKGDGRQRNHLVAKKTVRDVCWHPHESSYTPLDVLTRWHTAPAKALPTVSSITRTIPRCTWGATHGVLKHCQPRRQFPETAPSI